MSSVLLYIRNILTGSINSNFESEAVRKTLIINLVSLIGVFFLLFCRQYNSFNHNILIEYISVFSMLFLVSIVIYLRLTKNYLFASYTLLILFLFFSALLLFEGENENLFYFLYYSFPIVSFSLIGLKRGIIFCFILLGVYITFILIPPFFPQQYTRQDQLWYIFSFIAISAVGAAIEHIRAKTYNEIEKQQTGLEQIVNERTSELKIAKEKAEQADKLKASFLENLSHEIRTPMNAIVGFSNLLLSENIDDNLKKEMINHIVSSSNILLSLVDDIIDVSNIESGHIEIHYHEVNVRNTVANIYNEFIESKSGSDIKLVYDLKESPEISIYSDANRISQILRHLLENAFKFTEKGEIHIGYTIENQDLVTFYVKDTGIGIPKSLTNKIFQRFATGDSNKHKFYRGAGLGLNLCKSLVELLGGTIEYTTKINKGTSFYFTIVSKPENISKNKTTLSTELNWDNKTILIAEDEECNYKYLKHLLNRTNATILWANNGQEAIDLASQHDIDLILMDIKMPVMNGLEATRVIKGINKNIPIIAQTAFIYENDEKISLGSGCDAYIAKPIGKNQLLELMQRFIK